MQAGDTYAPFPTYSDASWNLTAIEEGLGKRVRQRLFQTVADPWFDAAEMELTSERRRDKVLEKLPAVCTRRLPDIYHIYLHCFMYCIVLQCLVDVCQTSICNSVQKFSSVDLAADGDLRKVDNYGQETSEFVDPLRVQFRDLSEVSTFFGRYPLDIS